jgi:hypothetical protein
MDDQTFESILTKAREYREQRRKEHGSDFRFKDVNIAGLVTAFYYLGLRTSEIVGDIPRKYRIKDGSVQMTKRCKGLVKEDIELQGEYLRIKSYEVRKHGLREAPLWLPVDKPGVRALIEVWESALPSERIFPIGTTMAWRLVRQVSGKYIHYYRLNRATQFASHPSTTIDDLLSWFGWRDATTIKSYLARGGRQTKEMSDRL